MSCEFEKKNAQGIETVSQTDKWMARKSGRQRQTVGSQTDKTGRRDFLFAFQTPSLMFGGKEV